MRIGIAGCGGIGLSYAMLLSKRNHEAVIWSPSSRSLPGDRCTINVRSEGAIVHESAISIAHSMAELVSDVDAIIVAVPAYGYKNVLDQVAKHIHRGQSIILSGNLSFSSIYLSKRLVEQKKRNNIIVWNTTASTGRRQNEGLVSVSKIRSKVEASVVPPNAREESHILCKNLFGDIFVFKDIVSVELANLNPIVHLALVLPNMTRMELGEVWKQHEFMTPVVCNLLQKLDGERSYLAQALGIDIMTVQSAYLSDDSKGGDDLYTLVQKSNKNRRGVNGPSSLDTRYVTEDIPYGLVPLVKLAGLVGVEMPLHNAGIELVSSAYARSFIEQNDILPEIESAFGSLKHFLNVYCNGWDEPANLSNYCDR